MGVSIELLEIVLMELFSCEVLLVLCVTSCISDTETEKQKSKNQRIEKFRKKKKKQTATFLCWELNNKYYNIYHLMSNR